MNGTTDKIYKNLNTKLHETLLKYKIYEDGGFPSICGKEITIPSKDKEDRKLYQVYKESKSKNVCITLNSVFGWHTSRGAGCM